MKDPPKVMSITEVVFTYHGIICQEKLGQWTSVIGPEKKKKHLFTKTEHSQEYTVCI